MTLGTSINLEFTQGDDYELQIPMWIADADGNPTTTPLDPTGWTFRATVKPGYGSDVEWDATVTVTYTVGVECIVTLTWADTQTAQMPQSCHYDVLSIDPGGVDNHFQNGHVFVKRRYTS